MFRARKQSSKDVPKERSVNISGMNKAHNKGFELAGERVILEWMEGNFQGALNILA